MKTNAWNCNFACTLKGGHLKFGLGSDVPPENVRDILPIKIVDTILQQQKEKVPVAIWCNQYLTYTSQYYANFAINDLVNIQKPVLGKSDEKI